MQRWRPEGIPQLETHLLPLWFPGPEARKKTQKGVEGGMDSLCFYHSALESIQVGRVAEKQSELEIIALQRPL